MLARRASVRAALDLGGDGLVATRFVAALALATSITAAGCAAQMRTPVAAAPSLHAGYVLAPDGVRIFYAEAGSGPAVLLIHGLGGNHAVWYQQVPVFARSHRVVAISQRGFAPSQGDGTRYEVADLVADATAVLDALHIQRAHVIGQSMGGWTALGLTLTHPERVRSLVLADTTAGIRDRQIDAALAAATQRAQRLSQAPTVLARHPALDVDFSRRDPARAYLYQSLASFGAPSPRIIAAQLARTGNERRRLSRMRIPTLFVVGAQDPIFPPDVVRRAAAQVPGARVQVIEGAGHSPYYEVPKAWNQRVLEFLGRH